MRGGYYYVNGRVRNRFLGYRRSSLLVFVMFTCVYIHNFFSFYSLRVSWKYLNSVGHSYAIGLDPVQSRKEVCNVYIYIYIYIRAQWKRVKQVIELVRVQEGDKKIEIDQLN